MSATTNAAGRDKLFDLSGQVAVITGGASGLGEAIAYGFVGQGARVVLVDQHQEDRKSVV